MLSRRGIRFWSTFSFARKECFWAIFYQFLSPLQFSLLWRNRSGPVQLPFAAIFFSKYVYIHLAILFGLAKNTFNRVSCIITISIFFVKISYVCSSPVVHDDRYASICCAVRGGERASEPIIKPTPRGFYQLVGTTLNTSLVRVWHM